MTRNTKLTVLAILILFLLVACLFVKEIFLSDTAYLLSQGVFRKPVVSLFPMDATDSPRGGISDASEDMAGFSPPLSRAAERVTKKPFGLFVTVQDSPIRPERFQGYHTGTDFEIFPEELNAEVPVRAVCSGQLEFKRSVSGYGGVAVESCVLEGAPITIIYGHLKLTSISLNSGDNISAGDTLGVLGAAYSPETDGERKHLHLAFHKGDSMNILGYVQDRSELSDWIDPCSHVCHD